jgi:GNAT superfamily N-acetyltransferase
VTITAVSDTAGFVVGRSTPADVLAWRRLAVEVEAEFGAPMADDEKWINRLEGHIASRTAWAAYDGVDGPLAGGMWLASRDPDAFTIRWLAVGREHRRRGIARSLVEKGLEEAAGGPVNVVTFGYGHQMAAAAEAAMALYVNLGFEPAPHRPRDGPDGTPRAAFRHDNAG